MSTEDRLRVSGGSPFFLSRRTPGLAPSTWSLVPGTALAAALCLSLYLHHSPALLSLSALPHRFPSACIVHRASCAWATATDGVWLTGCSPSAAQGQERRGGRQGKQGEAVCRCRGKDGEADQEPHVAGAKLDGFQGRRDAGQRAVRDKIPRPTWPSNGLARRPDPGTQVQRRYRWRCGAAAKYFIPSDTVQPPAVESHVLATGVTLKGAADDEGPPRSRWVVLDALSPVP